MGTIMERVYGEGEIRVNSMHHMAIDELAPGFAVTARCPDGVVEAIRRGRVEFHRQYTELSMLISWARERLVRSYPEIIDYINQNYGHTGSFFAKSLLSDYVVSNNRKWELMARPGLALTRLYSAVRVLAYY